MTEQRTLETMVFEALGAASMCWDHPERAGVFDDTRAREIGEKLLAELRGGDHCTVCSRRHRKAPSQASDTSAAAARSVVPHLNRIRTEVLKTLRDLGGSATADELQEASGLGGSTVRPRLIELARPGWVTKTDQTRPTRSGRQANVWALNYAGELALNRGLVEHDA